MENNYLNRMTYDFDNIKGTELSKEDELLFNFNRLVSVSIRSQRKALCMTQEELSKRSGVSRVTISAIEKRKRLVSTEILLKLLDALGLIISFSQGEIAR